MHSHDENASRFNYLLHVKIRLCEKTMREKKYKRIKYIYIFKILILQFNLKCYRKLD